MFPISIDFSSLRLRLLLPLLVGATVASVLVASWSFSAGRTWAFLELDQRRAVLEKTIRKASFPITKPVADLLAGLLNAEVVVMDESKQVSVSSLQLDPSAEQQLAELSSQHSSAQADVASTEMGLGTIGSGGSSFFVHSIDRQRGKRYDASERYILVLFDQQSINAASRRAAMLPLLTGLSTVGLLTTVTFVITSRLASRIARLQHSVQEVASGNFETSVADQSQDEIGRLGRTIDEMSVQLKCLWSEVKRQQAGELLHQVSAAMAHQLRNTLTGAKLAIELHQKAHREDSAEISVALREMTIAEDYVKRLMLASSGEYRSTGTPETVANCLNAVRSSHDLLGQHHGIELNWTWDETLDECLVADGESFRSAISNLVLNAIQAGSCVQVVAKINASGECTVTISDDGPGVSPDLADELFEPFSTSKQEGMGLGLVVVRRAAQQLGGDATWQRDGNLTKFVFTSPIHYSKDQ